MLIGGVVATRFAVSSRVDTNADRPSGFGWRAFSFHVALDAISSYEQDMKEIWKTIPSATDYECSSIGNVRRANPDSCGRKPRQLKLVVKSNGRLQVSLCVNRRVLSREVSHLVAETFIGPRPQGLFVCHKNGQALENTPQNLYYGTPKQNSEDAIRHGVIARGSANGNSRLTEDQAAFILTFCGTATEAAAICGVSVSTACRVRKRETWSHLKSRTEPLPQHDAALGPSSPSRRFCPNG